MLITRLSVGSLVCGLVALPLSAVPVASMVLAVAGLTCGIVGHDAAASDFVPVRRRYARLGTVASAGALVLALLVWHVTKGELG